MSVHPFSSVSCCQFISSGEATLATNKPKQSNKHKQETALFVLVEILQFSVQLKVKSTRANQSKCPVKHHRQCWWHYRLPAGHACKTDVQDGHHWPLSPSSLAKNEKNCIRSKRERSTSRQSPNQWSMHPPPSEFTLSWLGMWPVSRAAPARHRPLTTCAVPSHPNHPGRTGCSLSFLLLLLSAFLLPFAFVCQPVRPEQTTAQGLWARNTRKKARERDLFLSPPSQSVSDRATRALGKKDLLPPLRLFLWGLKGTKMKTIENEDGNDDERPCVCVCVNRAAAERKAGRLNWKLIKLMVCPTFPNLCATLFLLP